MSKLFKAVVYYAILVVTLPVWLPIMLGLLIMFNFISTMNHKNQNDGDTNDEM